MYWFYWVPLYPSVRTVEEVQSQSVTMTSVVCATIPTVFAGCSNYRVTTLWECVDNQHRDIRHSQPHHQRYRYKGCGLSHFFPHNLQKLIHFGEKQSKVIGIEIWHTKNLESHHQDLFSSFLHEWIILSRNNFSIEHFWEKRKMWLRINILTIMGEKLNRLSKPFHKS